MTHKIVARHTERACHKIALELHDGVRIETAFHHPQWLCVSSQAGCPLACSFCETGVHGLRRNLTSEEILAQVAEATGYGRAETGTSDDFQTISFSGMGEPLLNLKEVAAAMRTLHARTSSTLHLSTLGILPRLPELFALDVPFALDLSLHATTDEVRDKLIPVNQRYPIAPLLDTLFELNARRGALLTICYLLFDGVNDTDEDLLRLIALLKGRRVWVELKRYNPISRDSLRPSRPERFVAFRDTLTAAGLPAYVFGNEGLAINAGCGQLVWNQSQPGQSA